MFVGSQMLMNNNTDSSLKYEKVKLEKSLLTL